MTRCGLVFCLLAGCATAPELGAPDTGAPALQRTADTGELPLQASSDLCPDNPGKEDPGLCGCDYMDLDLADPVGAETCVHIDAIVDGTLGAGATVHADAQIRAGASVGPGAVVHPSAIVAERATIGADATVGEWSVVARRATVGAGSDVGPDSYLGRSSSVGEDVDAAVGSLTLGYAASVGDRCVVEGTGVMLGSLSSIGADCRVGARVVVARSAQIGPNAILAADTVIGPGVVAAAGLQTGTQVRIRKNVRMDAGVFIDQGAAIGRGAYLRGNATVGRDANLGANVTVGENAFVDEDVRIARNTVIPDRSLDPCEPAPGEVAPPPVVISAPLTLTDSDTSLLCADLVVSSTLTASGAHHFRSLTVVSGGTVTHPPRDIGGLSLTISNTLDVQANGDIDVTGKGGRGAWRDGNASSYGETWVVDPITEEVTLQTAGGPKYAGGSYGEQGRTGIHGTLNPVYGDPRNPMELGTGGGTKNQGSAYYGGNGGGRIDIVAGDVNIDGDVRADGNPCGNTCGGGSGGAIRIAMTGALTGSGVVSSKGGLGNVAYRSGGDGRIAISGLSTNAFGGSLAAATVFALAADGTQGIYVANGRDAALSVESGEVPETLQISDWGTLTLNQALNWTDLNVAGRVIVNQPLTLSGELHIAGPGTSELHASVVAGTWRQSNGGVEAFSTVTAASVTHTNGTAVFHDVVDVGSWVQSYGDVTLQSGASLDVPVFTLDRARFTNNGSLTIPAISAAALTNNTTFTNAGAVTVTDDTHLELGPNVTFNQHGNVQFVGLAPGQVSSLTVRGSATLQQEVQQVDGLASEVLGPLVVEANGTIDVTGAGGIGANRGGNTSLNGQEWTASTDPLDPSPVPDATNGAYYGGGSYGSRGRPGYHGDVNDTYGDPRDPREWGSGGGVKYASSGVYGGNGGGLILLSATSAVIDGELISNGDGCGRICGHGSGGAIRLELTDTFSGSGALEATAPATATYDRSAGGWGRIAVTGFTSNTFTGTAQAGTVFLMGASGNDGVYQVSGSGASMDVLAGETPGAFSIESGGSLAIDGPLTWPSVVVGGSLSVTGPVDIAGTLSGSGSGTVTFDDDVNVGAVSLSNKTLTIHGDLTTPSWTQSHGSTTLNGVVAVDAWQQTQGTTTIPVGVVFAPTSLSLNHATFVNRGTSTFPTFDATSVAGGSRITNEGELIITDDTLVEIGPATGSGTWLTQHGMFRGAGRANGTVNALRVGGGGRILQTQQTPGGLALTALGAIELLAGSRLDVTGAGGRGGKRSGNTGEEAEWFDNGAWTTVNGAYERAGGSYATAGQVASGSGTNPIHDSASNPLGFGAGGGASFSQNSSYGGNGGGRIDLVAASAVLDGLLIADGTDCGVVCGGGSGGAIRVQVSGSVSGTGSMSAMGGTGGNNSRVGGHGRVAVFGQSSGSYTGTVDAGSVHLP